MRVSSRENEAYTIEPTRNLTRPRTSASWVRGRRTAKARTSSRVTGMGGVLADHLPLRLLFGPPRAALRRAGESRSVTPSRPGGPRMPGHTAMNRRQILAAAGGLGAATLGAG